MAQKKYQLRELIKSKYGSSANSFKTGCQLTAQWLNGCNCTKHWTKESISSLCSIEQETVYELPYQEKEALRQLFNLASITDLLTANN